MSQPLLLPVPHPPAPERAPNRVSADAREVYVTPRLSAPAPGAITVRVARRPEGLVVHVTAPTPELAERAIHRLFGPGQAFSVELCG